MSTLVRAVAHSKRRRPIRVFISHSTADTVFARKLRSLLSRRANAQVFTAEDLSAGERWEDKLRHELASADVVLAVLTPLRWTLLIFAEYRDTRRWIRRENSLRLRASAVEFNPTRK